MYLKPSKGALLFDFISNCGGLFSEFSFGFYCNFDLIPSIYISAIYGSPMLFSFAKTKLEKIKLIKAHS